MNIDDPQKYAGLGNGFISDEQIIQQKTQKYLLNWMTILENGKMNKQMFDEILANAVQIIKLTSFSPEILKGTNKDVIISQLQDFISFYEKTAFIFERLPHDEQEMFRPEMEILEHAGQYAVTYYKALNYLVSAEILYGYRISKGNKFYFLEMLGVMGLVRKIYGIQTGIYLSKKYFIKEITKVKTLGNAIIEGLYGNKVEQSIDDFFKEKEKPQYFDLGITESWKVRKMLARFFPLVFFARSLISSVLANSFSPWKLIISFFTGVGLSVILHWMPILSGFFKTLTIKKMKKNDLQTQKNSIEINKQLLLQKQINNLADIPYGDMPDLVIIAGSGGNYTTDVLSESMLKIKRYANLQTLKIEPLTVGSGGGNGNSLMDIFSFLQSDDFKRKYPDLAAKDLENLKIVVVNADGIEQNLVTQPLDIEIITPQTTALELALLNGIGLIQNDKKQNGGIVIVDPSYMYLGNLTQTDNITLLSPNITYEQMQTQNLPLFISGQLDATVDGSSRLKKIYNRFSGSKIANIVVKNMLSKMYDLDNLDIQQIPTFAGIIVMNFADKNKFRQIMEFMNAAKRYEENYKGRKFKIDLLTHLIVPLVRLANNEDIFVYLESLKYPMESVNKETKDDYDAFFWGLFNEFDKNFKNSFESDYVNVFTPNESLMTKIRPADKFYKKFITILSLLKEFNIKKQAYAAKHNIMNLVLPQKKTGLLIIPEITQLTKQYIFGFDNDTSNNITVTDFNQLSENKKDTNIIINVPVENFVISAKVVYDVLVDYNGKKHIIVAFVPVLFDNIDMYCSDTERDIIKSILSGDGGDEIDGIRKRMFVGRATLAFINELKINKNIPFITEDTSFVMQRIEPRFIFSFDEFGIFTNPGLVSDRFSQDKDLSDIRHINLRMASKTRSFIPEKYVKQLNLSNLIDEYNITEDGKVNISILSSLIAYADMTVEETDIDMLFNEPHEYAKTLTERIFNGVAKHIENSTDNIRMLPLISPAKISDVKRYFEMLNGAAFNEIILNNIFSDGGNLFNSALIDIAGEIDRLNNDGLNKYKSLLNIQTEDIKTGITSNEKFVLYSLLNYLKSDRTENEKFTVFINGRTESFKRELQRLTAKQISAGLQNISDEDIEKLKKRSLDKWNFYYGLNEYMQYISYIQYGDVKRYLSDRQISIADDTGQSADEKSVNFDLGCVNNADIENILGKLSQRGDLHILHIDITEMFNNSAVMQNFLKINKLLLKQNKNIKYYYEQSMLAAGEYEKLLLRETSKQVVGIIDISGIDNAEEDIFKYARQKLSESNFNGTDYMFIRRYIDKLETEFGYSKTNRRKIIIAQLKGFLTGIRNCQNVIDINVINNNINTGGINLMLCSA